MQGAEWSGRLWIGRDWWGFEGASGASRAHRHLCAQVVVGLDGPARIEGEQGVVEGQVLAVAPGVRHRLLGSSGLRAIYPRPLGRLARRWEVNRWPASAFPGPGAWIATLISDRLAERLDAEAALTNATRRFEQRYRLVENMADKPLRDLNLAEYEILWARAKAQLAGSE